MRPYKAGRWVEVRVRKGTPKSTAVLAIGFKNSVSIETKRLCSTHGLSRLITL